MGDTGSGDLMAAQPIGSQENAKCVADAVPCIELRGVEQAKGADIGIDFWLEAVDFETREVVGEEGGKVMALLGEDADVAVK